MSGDASDMVQGYIYYFGTWEPNLTEYIRKSLSDPTRTFIDIGANVGYFSLLASGLLTRGRVVSIEALPEICRKLAHNVELNRVANIRIVNCAVSDQPGQLTMHHAIGNEGASTSKSAAVSRQADRFDPQAVIVPALPVDQILSDVEIDGARFLKIDVEGAEFDVLSGLFRIIDRLPFDAEVAVELNPHILSAQELAQVFDKFAQLGFLPYVVANDYRPDYYISRPGAKPPTRLDGLPQEPKDVIFSRMQPVPEGPANDAPPPAGNQASPHH